MQNKTVDFRLPLEGHLDLTYRCNNNCLHCWLKIPPASEKRNNELSFDEIRVIVDEARSLGTRRWSMSGGEPMLRPDFSEIFDYITAKAVSYSLNTNGTLITPKLARQLKRKGTKMVALYGATKETYAHVTGNPAGFEQLMQGFSYLREEKVGFIVQLVPMKANWHEWEAMVSLAKSLSPQWRIGAPWLYLSSCRDASVNARISAQRLAPQVAVELDRPDISYEESNQHRCGYSEPGGRLFASCLDRRRDFHIDPYGGMSFCSFIKDPSMRYDLRKGTVQEGWEEFIPSLADKVHGGQEHRENCGSCELRDDCRWCAVYGWLEHGRYSAPVKYLCEVAREYRSFKENYRRNHRRFFRVAGLSIQLDSDLPFEETTLNTRLAAFRTKKEDEPAVTILHNFEMPELDGQDLGKELHQQDPWTIYRQNGAGGSHLYLFRPDGEKEPSSHRFAAFNAGITRARIYSGENGKTLWMNGDLRTLTMFPSDRLLLARLLAFRQGYCINSIGAVIEEAGVLFVNCDINVRSPIPDLLDDAAIQGSIRSELLSDTLNLVRRDGPEWKLYGTWEHERAARSLPGGVTLNAICFTGEATDSSVSPVTESTEAMHHLLAAIAEPFLNVDQKKEWLELLEALVKQLPCYLMRIGRNAISSIESGSPLALLQQALTGTMNR
jgi:MoaA/NifB/PqqE/SkfB family radical SAM enzyme